MGLWWNGIHGALKMRWSKDHAGSNPVSPIKREAELLQVRPS